MIYLCGQACADATKDISEQTQTMLDKVDELLLEAGSNCKHILSTTIYVKDMGKHFAAMNAVWDAVIGLCSGKSLCRSKYGERSIIDAPFTEYVNYIDLAIGNANSPALQS